VTNRNPVFLDWRCTEYELLLSDTDATLRAVASFLQLDPEPLMQQQASGGGGALHKATPDRLCQAVTNYQALCRAYARTEYAGYFDASARGVCACDGGGGGPTAAAAASSPAGSTGSRRTGGGRKPAAGRRGARAGHHDRGA